MIEHRTIGRMLTVLAERSKEMAEKKIIPAPEFIGTVVDFFMTYADRCHHGKEEGILFRELQEKQLIAIHRTIMNELIEDHAFAREICGSLNDANVRYLKGEIVVFAQIMSSIDTLLRFYPRHIEKEDKHFFLPCMSYFSTREQAHMLEEFWEFDRQLIHERYMTIIEALEGKSA
jgi:hemerythrin-like domain-containing protein